MPIDTSIYSQIQQPKIESPLNALAQVAQLQHFQSQNKLADLTYGEKQREVDQTNALNGVYKGAIGSDGTIDRTKLYTGVAGVAGTKLPGIQKGFADADKAAADALKINLENGLKKFEVVGQAMSGVKDQASYSVARQQLAQIFPDMAANIPDVYDPATVESSRVKAMAVKDQMEQKLKEITQTETQRHNKATEGLTLRGQNQTDARSRDANNVPEYKQDENGNWIALPKRIAPGQQITAQPVFGPDGKPLAGGGKMTEDQGKATGWLVQAENAFKNMNSAVAGNPSAAKPGFPDVVAGIPSMGIGGAVANTMRGADRQKFMQGSSSLSEALLRAATGAGVNKDEAAQKIRELTPVFGDDAATIKQKMDAIPLYIESLKVRAGPGAKKASSIAGTGAPVKTAKFLGFE